MTWRTGPKRQTSHMTTNIYGSIINYQTGESLRPATRDEWQRAREIGDRDTGAHRDADGTVVFCDGPDEDPEPTIGQLEVLGAQFAAHLEDDHPTNEAANDWVTHADDDDLVGDLKQAIDLAKSLSSPITLLDEAGFTKGHVEPDGDYRLS